VHHGGFVLGKTDEMLFSNMFFCVIKAPFPITKQFQQYLVLLVNCRSSKEFLNGIAIFFGFIVLYYMIKPKPRAFDIQ
jgi:hypothetical protein